MKNTLLLLILLPLLSFGQSNESWSVVNLGNTFDGDFYIAYTIDETYGYSLAFRLDGGSDPMFSISHTEEYYSDRIESAKFFLLSVDENEIYHLFHNINKKVSADFYYAHLYSDKTFEESTILTMAELAEMLMNASKVEIRISEGYRDTDITFDLSGSRNAISEVMKSATEYYNNESYPMLWSIGKATEAAQALDNQNQRLALEMLCRYAGISYIGSLLYYDVDNNYLEVSMEDKNRLYPKLTFKKSLIEALTRLIRPTQEDYNRSVDAKEVDLIEVAKHFDFFELPNEIADYDAILYYRVDMLNQFRKDYTYDGTEDWWESDENFFKSFGITP